MHAQHLRAVAGAKQRGGGGADAAGNCCISLAMHHLHAVLLLASLCSAFVTLVFDPLLAWLCSGVS